MKKITMIAAVVAAMIMTSCGRTPKAQLANDIDTLCYACGMTQSNGFEDYAFTDRGLNIDSAYADDFLKGLIDGANLGGSEKQNAYYAGVGVGQQLASSIKKGLKYEVFGNDSTKEMNMNDFIAGLVDAVKKNPTAFTKEEAENIFRQKMQEVKNKVMEEKYGEYKKQNEAFMAKVAKEEGVKELGEGVYYKVLVEGTGATPSANARVKVNYEGKTIDGNIFDSTYKEGREPIELNVSGVIKGWTMALTHMPVGSKWLLYIPQEAAYGAMDQGPIKPYSALIFTVELLDIVSDGAAEPAMQIVPAN